MNLSDFLKAKSELKQKLERGESAKAAKQLGVRLSMMSQWFAATRFTKWDDKMMVTLSTIVKARKKARENAMKRAVEA